MKKETKKWIFLFVAAVISGLIFYLEPFAATYSRSYIQTIPDVTPELSITLLIALEVLLLTLLMLTPLPMIAGTLFLKLAYDLILGQFRGKNIFVIDPRLNFLFALLGIIVFAYSIKSQYEWAVKLAQYNFSDSDVREQEQDSAIMKTLK